MIIVYVAIVAVMMYIFSNLNINNSIILGTGLSLVLVYYLHDYVDSCKSEKQKNINSQISCIKPITTNISNNNEFVNFLFSIQDFYHLNPPVYGELIQSIDIFIDLFNITEIDNQKASSITYNDMLMYKHKAINSLKSLSLSINVTYEDKLSLSIYTLNRIMDGYLEIVKKKYAANLQINGINNMTGLVGGKVDAYDEMSVE